MKILAVCGMGFGSSMVLRMTIEAVLKAEHIKATVVVSDIGTAKAEPADVIVTSAEFAKMLANKRIPIVVVKNYVDRKEMKEKLLPVLQRS
jgi:PTS system ascorbate-specific IIB component